MNDFQSVHFVSSLRYVIYLQVKVFFFSQLHLHILFSAWHEIRAMFRPGAGCLQVTLRRLFKDDLPSL